MIYDLEKLINDSDQGNAYATYYYGEEHSAYIKRCVNRLEALGCDNDTLLMAMAYHDYGCFVKCMGSRDFSAMCKLNDTLVSIMYIMVILIVMDSELLGGNSNTNPVTTSDSRIKLNCLVLILTTTLCEPTVYRYPHPPEYYAKQLVDILGVTYCCYDNLLKQAIQHIKEKDTI